MEIWLTQKAIVLAGASRPSMSGVHILSLAYNESNISHTNSTMSDQFSKILQDAVAGVRLEVRMGYFGLCFATQAQSWYCGGNSGEIASLQSLVKQQDPLDLIRMGERFQDGALFTGLMWVFQADFPGWT